MARPALRVTMRSDAPYSGACGVYDLGELGVYRQRGGGDWYIYTRPGGFWMLTDKPDAIQKGTFKIL